MPGEKPSDIELRIGGALLSAEGYNDLASVEIVQDSEAPSMFTLELCVGGETGTDMAWADSADLAIGKEVEVALGRSGSLKTVIKGEITGLDLAMPRGEGEVPTLVVRGYDLRHRLFRSTKIQSFASMTDSAIASEIAKSVKLTPDVVDSKIAHEYVLQESVTDFDFLRQRAEPIGYTVIVEGGTLYFGPPKYGESKKVTLDAGSDVLEFYFYLSTQGMHGEVVVQGWAPATKEIVTGTAVAADIKSKMGTTLGISAADSAFGTSTLTLVDRGIEAKDVATQIAYGALEAAALNFIQGEGTCNGDTDIKPGVVVDISGYGTRFSGSYYVTKATHKYTAEEGYTVEINVRRNATS